jgi:hypothetical protein
MYQLLSEGTEMSSCAMASVHYGANTFRCLVLTLAQDLKTSGSSPTLLFLAV